jgi:hypothetical protein
VDAQLPYGSETPAKNSPDLTYLDFSTPSRRILMVINVLIFHFLLDVFSAVGAL